MQEIDEAPPAFAVVDVQLEDGSGLDVIAALKKTRPDVRAIALTGYGNIPNAIVAVREGAYDYLSKPCTADEIFVALVDTRRDGSLLPNNIMTADRVQWEHIQRVYEMCGRNVSATARRLNMHRRTLQRILAKRAPR